MQKNKKVLLALSGGVDSAVAGFILKKQGYNVSGLFFKIYSDIDTTKVERVASKLGIDLRIVDISDEFKSEVIEYFIKEYESGRTPNPCIVCNEKIKFGYILNKLNEFDCEFVATGHYARNIKNQRNQQCQLMNGVDSKKDQSYFLYRLTQDKLKKIIFPLGNKTKQEVREIANSNNLYFEKSESQDICFLKGLGLRQFLNENKKQDIGNGEIIDTSGEVVGRHNGLMNYTIGQKISGNEIDFNILGIKYDKDSRPKLYVLKLDLDNNIVVIGEEKELFSRRVSIDDVHWIDVPEIGKKYLAKIRYNGVASVCSVIEENGQWIVVFDKKQKAVTPGQSLVVYEKDKVIGGGIIK